MSSLLRSTKFVRYFTGAARTLILSSAKTAEANLLINPKTLSSVNNFTVRDYATKKKESLEPLLQKLDSEVRRYGRITRRDIEEVFDEIRAKNDITSSQSLLVIRCCGELVPEELPEQRTLLVQKIWNVLNERGVPMDVSHYNALLRVYLENEHPFSPAKFLEEMEQKGLQPNRVTYQRLMWHYCQEGDVDGATKVLEKMRELNMPVSEPVLNALVMGHAFHGDTEGAKAVLETMAGAGLEPTNRTYALLACGYAKKGDISGVESIIAMAKEKDTYLSDKDLLDIIEQLAIGGHEDKVDNILPHLHKGMGYNQEVCNLILKLLHKNLESTARKIMKTMPKSNNMENTKFKGAFYVKQLLKVNMPADSVIQSCRELQNEDLVPAALYIATETSLQLGKTELALKLFKELQKDGQEIRQHYYWPLLVQKGKEKDEEGLLQIVRTMTSDALVPTGEALRDYIIPYLIEKSTPQNVIVQLQLANVPVFHCARNVMIELLEAGKIRAATDIALQYRPRGQYNQVARSLINALNKTKDIESFTTILHVISSSPALVQEEDDSNDDSQADDNVKSNEIGRIVKTAVKNVSRANLTEQLLNSILSKGLKISTDSAEEIEQYLGESMTTEISELLAKLISPDLEAVPLQNARPLKGVRTTEQLERLLEQLKNKDGTNVNRLQKQLLSIYIQENNVDKVDNFLNELKSSNFELTNATLANLFEFYCLNDRIDKANEIQSTLMAKEPEFALNRFKKLQMASALVRADRYEEAIKYLNDNRPNDAVTSSFVLNSKSWQLLNTLAERKDPAKVREMTQALIDNTYINPTNVILGPSIKVYMLNDDIEGALKEFEYCCNQYRSTPWKGELMKALIMKEDATKLQWLADLSTQIHGEVNILHDLVFAFVECGRLRQARRILETPGLQTKQRRLLEACQRYVEEGKSEYLEGILEATKDLTHIDRPSIFHLLLVTYCKADETDKALGLWTLLQEEGEVPSEEFLLHLGKHLQSKNRPVPFVVPEVEQQVTPKREPVQKTITIKKPPSKNNISEHIENLIKEGKTSLAMDCTIKALEDGLMPKSNVMKYLLKNLAEDGNVEKIMSLEKYINEPMRRRLTYDDKLTQATFARGAGAQHIDNLKSAIETAKSDEDYLAALKKFPRSNALATVVRNEELLAKCRKVAEMAASKGQMLPANLIWMELLLAGRDREADSLWQQCLSKSEVVVFRRLLQESHQNNQPQLMEKLIEILKTNSNISMASIGNAYSRLINYYLVNDKLDMAKAALEKAYESGVTNEHLNKTSLDRLNAGSVTAEK